MWKQALDTFHLHTKFGDPHFSRSEKKMIAGVEIENGSCDPDKALLWVICHPKARIWHSLYAK